MPARGFLSFLAQSLALAPSVPFANVPSVQFQDQGEGFQGQLKLKVTVLLSTTFGLAHLPVHLLSLLLGSLALLPRLPRQGRRRNLDPRQALHDLFGFRCRHFAHRQRRHLLHRGRLCAFLRKAQQHIRWKTPLATPLAIASGPSDANGAESSLNARPMALLPAA